MFYVNLMMSSAGSDQDVGCGNRESGGTRAACKLKGDTPDRRVNGKFRKQSFKLPEHFSLTIAARPIP